MKIVIVEDQPIFRELVRNICQRELGLEVIGETGSGVEALQLIACRLPDLVILDLKLDEVDGFAVLAHAKGLAPVEVRFLVLSAHCDAYTVHRCDKANVNGFLDKHTNTVSALCEAITTIQGGGRYFSPRFQAVRWGLISDPHSFPKTLSEWQQGILNLVARGYDDDEIANKLGISTRTAKTHRGTLLRKLGVKSTPKLMALAQELGFARFGSD